MSNHQASSRKMIRPLFGGLAGALVAGIGFLILFAVAVATDTPMIGKNGLVIAALVLPLVCVTCGVMIARRSRKPRSGPNQSRSPSPFS